MSDVSRETTPTAAERIATAQRMLAFLGIADVAVDMTQLIGQINAIASILIERGLVTQERIAELAQEHRADFLEQLVQNSQAVARARSNVGPQSAKEKQA
jgi:hypothetical protein